MGQGVLHICLIDDDRGDYLLTRQLLAKAGDGRFALEWVDNFEAGRAAIAGCRHDVFLLDYRLGAEDGLELLREAQIAMCGKPMILLTGQGDNETDEAAMAAGASDYLVKGHIDAPTLWRSIRYAVESKRSEQALRAALEDRDREIAERKHAERQIRDLNAQLEDRVRERTASLQSANDELEQALSELAATDRRKDEFLAMLGHELRNPLGAISNALSLAQARAAGNDALQRPLTVLARQVRHMGRLVDDLLDVARITSGKIELRPERVEAAALMSHAVEATRPLMDSHGHTLTVQYPDEAIHFQADRGRIEQVLVNLLSNAAKYSETGGQITLSAVQEDGHAVFRVQDKGIGIPPDLLPHIFGLFTQGERALDRSQGGLGIGLTLVKSLVEKHGGSVEAHSEGEGKGSEFVVRLPLPVGVRSQALGVGSEPSAQHPIPSTLRVLLVDDNEDAVMMMAEILQSWGYETRVASDGPAALEAVADTPDVVLLDIGLPGMDGYEVARRLREKYGDGLRLVALTGYSQAEDRMHAYEAGFDAHLSKPVDIALLQNLLAEMTPAPQEDAA